jgi:hypothetical protein
MQTIAHVKFLYYLCTGFCLIELDHTYTITRPYLDHTWYVAIPLRVRFSSIRELFEAS